MLAYVFSTLFVILSIPFKQHNLNLDKTIGYQVKSVWHSISKMYNSFAEEYNLTFTMALVLLSLDDEEGMPSTQIGPSVGLEPRSLTRLLKKMEDEDLITKKPSKTDKRQVYIILTENGIEKKKIARDRVTKFNKEIKQSISKEELDVFDSVLKRIKSIANKNYENEQ